jgi:hypothetical protein
VEISKETERINQKQKEKMSQAPVNLITKLTPDADYL